LRLVRNVSVPHRRPRLGVTQKLSDNWQRHASADKVTRIGMTKVVNPGALDTGSLRYLRPSLLDFLKRLTVNITRKEKGALGLRLHFGEQPECRGTKGNVFGRFGFCVVRWLGPDATVEIEIFPFGGQRLAAPRSGQYDEPEHIRGMCCNFGGGGW